MVLQSQCHALCRALTRSDEARCRDLLAWDPALVLFDRAGQAGQVGVPELRPIEVATSPACAVLVAKALARCAALGLRTERRAETFSATSSLKKAIFGKVSCQRLGCLRLCFSTVARDFRG